MYKFRDQIEIIKANGDRKTGLITACFRNDTVHINDAMLDISDGDFIDRVLPNNNRERYLILDTGFRTSNGCDKDHYQCLIKKITSIPSTENSHINYYLNGNNTRIYNQSSDFSTNNVELNENESFRRLKMHFVAIGHSDEIIEHISDLEEHKYRNEFNQKYKDFIALYSGYMSEISQFIPFLTTFLKAT